MKWVEVSALAFLALAGLRGAYRYRSKNNPRNGLELAKWYGLALAGGALLLAGAVRVLR